MLGVMALVLLPPIGCGHSRLRYISRYEGNPAELMEKPFAAIDTIVNVLEGNPTLDGTAAGVTSIRAFHRPSKFREVIDVGGFIWQLFNIELDVLEWGGG